MPNGKLTAKQEIFCLEYCIDWDAKRAAIKAGYSEKTAYAIGWENLNKPDIKTRISEIKADIEKHCGVSAARNILELKKIAYADIGNLKNGWISLKEWEDITDEQKAGISEIKITEHGVQIKLHDKMRAMEILNKMLGYNAPEKHDVEFIEQPLFTKRK